MLIKFAVPSGKEFKVYTPLYFDDMISDLDSLHKRDDKIAYLTELKNRIPALDKVMNKLIKGRGENRSDQVKNLDDCFNPVNEPGYAIKNLLTLMDSRELEIALSKNDRSRYCLILSCLTKCEHDIFLNYIRGKALRFKGVSPIVINEVFEMGKVDAPNTTTKET